MKAQDILPLRTLQTGLVLLLSTQRYDPCGRQMMPKDRVQHTPECIAGAEFHGHLLNCAQPHFVLHGHISGEIANMSFKQRDE